MKLVIIESPYAGDIERNVPYARACMADSLARGEAPFASHLLYTQPGILDDNDLTQRERGIDAGWKWGLAAADVVAFYIDLGMSTGMYRALHIYGSANDILLEVRQLKDWAGS